MPSVLSPGVAQAMVGVPYQIIDPAPRAFSVPVGDGCEPSIQSWIDAS
jgi:hypothetical protein